MFFHDLISVIVIVEKMIFVWAKETQISQPFCGPEGRFDCSESVFSLRRPVPPFSGVRVIILCTLKIAAVE